MRQPGHDPGDRGVMESAKERHNDKWTLVLNVTHGTKKINIKLQSFSYIVFNLHWLEKTKTTQLQALLYFLQ